MGIAAKKSFSEVPGFPWRAKVVVKHDTNNLTAEDGITEVPQTVRVGTGGTVQYLPYGQATPITETFPDHYIIPCLVRRIYNTGTSATNLVGYY